MSRDLGQLLFGFEGRVNRARFWLIPIMPAMALLVFAVVAAVVLETFVGRGAGPALALIVTGTPIVLAWLLITISLTVRRLHDRDRSGHWAWLFLGFPYLILLLTSLIHDPARAPVLVFLALLGALCLGVSVWYFVECGCLRGTRGPNRFGPDPLAPETAADEGELRPVRPSRPPRPSGPPRSRVTAKMPEAMGGAMHSLFSFHGRLNRAPYWGWSILITVIHLSLVFGLAAYFGWLTSEGINADKARLPSMVIWLLLLWPAMALIVKRLNDRDRPAWLAAPILLPGLLNLALSKNVGQFRFDTATDSIAELIIGVLTAVAFVYSFIELGCLRGTTGENGHGADPLEGKDRRRQPAVREA